MTRVPTGRGDPRSEGGRSPRLALALQTRLALRPREVAEALGLSERTVREILPELPHVRIGTAVVVSVDLLREWLRDRAQQEKGAVDQAVDEVLEGLAGGS